MITLLSRIFIKDRENTASASVRRAYGVLCGAFGVFLNALLAAAKFFAGVISGSIAITADAFNNLTDAAASFAEMLGFHFSGSKPDYKHPFGHGRIEYVTGLIISLITIVVGFELAKSSVQKIISGEETAFSTVAVIILAVSVLVKLYMAFYNRKIGTKINSAAVKAVYYDSLSDCVATFAALAAMIVSRVSGVSVDGYCGCAISVFIMFSGVRAAVEAANPLLGTQPSKDLTEKIENTVMAYPGIFGVHDLIVHDYGPGRVMISLHAEVRSDANLLDIHTTVDAIERELHDKLGCSAVIHIDPIEVDDELTTEMRQKVTSIAASIEQSITIHDFRMVKYGDRINVIFDAVLPYSLKISERELKKTLQEELNKLDNRYVAVINIDRSDVI